MFKYNSLKCHFDPSWLTKIIPKENGRELGLDISTLNL